MSVSEISGDHRFSYGGSRVPGLEITGIIASVTEVHKSLFRKSLGIIDSVTEVHEYPFRRSPETIVGYERRALLREAEYLKCSKVDLPAFSNISSQLQAYHKSSEVQNGGGGGQRRRCRPDLYMGMSIRFEN